MFYCGVFSSSFISSSFPRASMVWPISKIYLWLLSIKLFINLECFLFLCLICVSKPIIAWDYWESSELFKKSMDIFDLFLLGFFRDVFVPSRLDIIVWSIDPNFINIEDFLNVDRLGKLTFDNLRIGDNISSSF